MRVRGWTARALRTHAAMPTGGVCPASGRPHLGVSPLHILQGHQLIHLQLLGEQQHLLHVGLGVQLHRTIFRHWSA